MRKCIIIYIAILIVIQPFFHILDSGAETLASDSPYAGGSGTLEEPYQIATVQQLDNVRNHLDKYFVLINDIDLGSVDNWKPIGNYDIPFTGSLNGKGFTLENLKIAGTNTELGLFGSMRNATISNITLKEFNITGRDLIGALAGGALESTIQNIYVNGGIVKSNGIEQNTTIGGLLGGGTATTILNVASSATIESTSGPVGGLIGNFSSGTLTNAYATGNVSVSGNSLGTGGLIGQISNSTIKNTYATGQITYLGDPFVPVGGLIGSKGMMGLFKPGMGDTSVVTSSYYASSTGQNDTEKGEQKTNDEMKLISTFENWDFETVYDINPNVNDGYPYLRYFSHLYTGIKQEIPEPTLKDIITLSWIDGTSEALTINANKDIKKSVEFQVNNGNSFSKDEKIDVLLKVPTADTSKISTLEAEGTTVKSFDFENSTYYVLKEGLTVGQNSTNIPINFDITFSTITDTDIKTQILAVRNESVESLIEFTADTMEMSDVYGVFNVTGGPLYYSKHAKNGTEGAEVELSPISFLNNLSLEISNSVNVLNVIHPVPPVFLIYANNAISNDTVTLKLNQFQDSKGTILSGSLVLTYNGFYWIPSVVEGTAGGNSNTELQASQLQEMSVISNQLEIAFNVSSILSNLTDNTDLSNLTISKGTLSPQFSTDLTDYSVDVEYLDRTIRVTPYSEDNNAEITINDIKVSSGEASESIPLSIGENTLLVKVTSSDGTQHKSYKLVVNRASEYNAYYNASRRSVPSVYEVFQIFEAEGATNIEIYHWEGGSPQPMHVDLQDRYYAKYKINSQDHTVVIRLRPSYDDYVMTYNSTGFPTIADLKLTIKESTFLDEVFLDYFGNKVSGEKFLSGVFDPITENLYFRDEEKVSDEYIIRVYSLHYFTSPRDYRLVINRPTPTLTPKPTPIPIPTLTPTTDSGSSTQPVSEIITVPVETGNLGEVVVNKTPINRTKESNGKVRDQVTLTKDIIDATINTVKNSGKDNARVVIPDLKDEVSLIDFSVPKAATQELNGKNVNLEVYTENVRILIPYTSLNNFIDDLYFRFIPIKENQQRKEVEERAKVEQIVKAIAQEKNIEIVARPMTIETNLQSRPVSLILPLRDVQLPIDEKIRKEFLANLVIFIEHSDGEKKLVKPEVVEYKEGQLGLQFGVNKFSTFTILNIEGWEDSYHKVYVKGYEDGTYRPDTNISRAQIAAILARNLGYEEFKVAISHYPDVKQTHWAHGEIEFLKSNGLMVGDKNGKFRPDAPITRGEMAAIAIRYKEISIPEVAKSSFKDVPNSHWAVKSIEAIKNEGIVVGYSDGTFKPNGNLSRAEAVKIVNRLFNRGPLFGVTKPSWSDVPTTHWAFYEIEEASQNHFYSLRPEGGENIIK